MTEQQTRKSGVLAKSGLPVEAFKVQS